ncbi:hydroxylase [Rhodococcus sp. 06-462-5]|uniref:fumarylacetoacetate hydrolase family protein n=1 Tax=unclassified Rhodococcus (in: high G+C Gram-positive bacteria) TaxID=192944 RepID=UPI000B9BEF32|nr:MULTISPECIES: fumarylacetoacetate hydrolase family protein [unclassified Rhodococcus (in: high G+C Gram-positive bacteria)]OZC77224.1 hydroxylase [Rhodococcus sp. 06-462-5]OZE63381.1 hydroxylase [Rhodococcus sp. 02-925g]
MRFVTVRADGNETVGVVENGTIHTMAPRTRLIDLLGDDGERLATAGQAALADPRTVLAFADADLAPPIVQPPAVRDFVTFEQHMAGTAKLAWAGGGVPPLWYDIPTFYFTNPHTLAGARDEVPMPPGSEMLDFELEVAAVIGREGRNLSPEAAASHIVGFTIMNDWSARDLQFEEMKLHLGPAKGKDTATTLGPALVTIDELQPRRSGTSYDLTMTASVNGTVIGSDLLSNMYWSFEELVAYASRGTRVLPGDVLGSGTCGGGSLAELWGRNGRDSLQSIGIGDVVTMEVEILGELSNRVRAGDPVIPLRPSMTD